MTIDRRNTEVPEEKSAPVPLFLPPIPSGIPSTEPGSRMQENVARTMERLPSATVFVYIYHIYPLNVSVRALQLLHKPASPKHTMLWR
jgi:hypothetical protein